MQVNNRLFEIVYILMQKKKTTAKELADRFEVSTRTIYRDIETLSTANIPIYASKGKDGGIGLVEEYVVKLETRIKEILKTDVVDKERLNQEIVIYADKCSVEEELTRLKSHMIQFRGMLEEETPIGKKIDFLIQEMNRETNTIGSKSGSLEITNLVIDIKTRIEDIREQIQNIE